MIRSLFSSPKPTVDLGMLHLALAFRVLKSREAEDALDERADLQESYLAMKAENDRLREARRKCEITMMRNGIEIPDDDDLAD